MSTAVAHSNIALVKYWGKRTDAPMELNLPAVGSVSVTLSGMSTKTTVDFHEDLHADEIVLRQGGHLLEHQGAIKRVATFLDLVRRTTGTQTFARVASDNDFPTGAGLASSASGFAALALAASDAAGASVDTTMLSRLARCGSGSAARSIFGGFVMLQRGTATDGSDCTVKQLATPSHWPLHVWVAITSDEHKKIGSTQGMNQTAQTSAYYNAWLSSHDADMLEAQAAIATRDFDRLGRITESSCLKMHGLMLSANPGLLYWKPATVAVMQEVIKQRLGGIPVCFTIDAGPQVKVICEASVAQRVGRILGDIPGVLRLIGSPLGDGARLL